MGDYLNVGNAGFTSVRKGLYVDKTDMIAFINGTLGTTDKLTCVSRPRRFGKSFAAKMLCAYYDKSCDSQKLFENLRIAGDESFRKHLNKYDVIYLDITWFISIVDDMKRVVSYLQKAVIQELREAYPHVAVKDTLAETLSRITDVTGNKFIIIIDEWDALFREAKYDQDLQEEYIQMLRGLFKSSGQTDKMIEAAYLTGILPIKKYGTQSAVSDFREYTMIAPGKLAKYVGFTEDEVNMLCERHGMDFKEMKHWYDGYSISCLKSVYNPNSVMEAIKNEEFGNFWTRTETYESLKIYIELNEDGLREAIVQMLGGAHFKINVGSFQNDMTTIKVKDDVLTLLVHLGYNEQALRSVIRFAYISCMDEFLRIEELPSGHGYADVVLLPKKTSPMPVLLIELKWNQTDAGAIRQIKDRNYPQVFAGYGGDVLMVGINYDEGTKKHTCKIETCKAADIEKR